MVSKHENEEQCQIIPDYSHDFAIGPAVETQLSWLFLSLFLIIPNYSYYAHNKSRSNGHSLGNQPPQARAIACRGPEDQCLHPVIESHTRPILPVAVVASLEAAKGSSQHESRWSLGAELASAGGALRDQWIPCAPFGSSLPLHEEIQIPDLYMQQCHLF